MVDPVSEQAKHPIPIPVGSVEFVSDTEVELDASEIPQKRTMPDGIPKQSFFAVLKSLIVTNLRMLPRRLTKDVVWLGPLVVLWVLLWSIPAMTLLTMPKFLSSLASGIIFLTATYNGFLGKAAFITVLSRTLIPIFQKSRSGGLTEFFARYRKTAKLISGLVTKGKVSALKMLLFSGGTGLVISNLLTRNNKIDKYLVCLLCAFALFDDLAKGPSNPVIRLVASGLRDLPALAGLHLKVNLQTAYLAITGFAFGLALAFVPGLFSQTFVSPIGAIFGAVVIGISLAIPKGGLPNVKQPK